MNRDCRICCNDRTAADDNCAWKVGEGDPYHQPHCHIFDEFLKAVFLEDMDVEVEWMGRNLDKVDAHRKEDSPSLLQDREVSCGRFQPYFELKF